MSSTRIPNMQICKVHLLWDDFYGGNVTFHVEHFRTSVAAQKVTTVDTDSTPVLIGVVVFPTSTLRRIISPASLVYASVGERASLTCGGRWGSGGYSVSGRGGCAVQAGTRRLRCWFCFDAFSNTPEGILAYGCNSEWAVLWTAHLKQRNNKQLFKKTTLFHFKQWIFRWTRTEKWITSKRM